jgi:phosphate transport system permease protein
MSSATLAPAPKPAPRTARRWRSARRTTAPGAQGEPWLWLSGGALALALAMIAGLLLLIVVRGGSTFWPAPLVRIERVGAPALLGEVSDEDPASASGAHRRLLRTGNFDVTGKHFEWVSDGEVAAETRPEWALAIERTAWGRFHGQPKALIVDGRSVADDPSAILARFEPEHERARERAAEKKRIEQDEIGAVNRAMEPSAWRCGGSSSSTGRTRPSRRRRAPTRPNARASSSASTTRSAGASPRWTRPTRASCCASRPPTARKRDLVLAEIVRAYPANHLSWWQRLGVYLSRWHEFLTDGRARPTARAASTRPSSARSS